MIYNEFLSIAATIYLAILIISYFPKVTIKTTCSRVYKMIIISMLIFFVTEMLSIAMLAFNGNNNIALQIAWRIHYGTELFSIGLVILYINTKLLNIKDQTIIQLVKENKQIKYSQIISLLVSILIMVLPYDPISMLEFSYLNPVTEIVFGIYVFLVVIYIFILFIQFKNRVEPVFKKTIYGMVVSSVLVAAFQFILSNIAMIPLLFAMVIYMIYFMLENPDIEILNEITDSKDEIEKSNQTKTDFLSNMSYEIKNPMYMIISLCDELNNMPTFDTQEAKEYIKLIVDSGNSLLDIINNVLDISKIETGKDTLSEKDYRVKDFISNIINAAKQKVGSKPVKLLVNIDQATSSVLYGDSSKLYQALTNVVNNAVRYTDIGRVTVTLSSTRSGGEEHLLFKISDTGCGIKEEDQKKIFDKGNKIAKKQAEEQDGSGLGLVIAKQYIESMGGKIWFESQFRVGTTFFIEVNQRVVDATPIGSETVTEATSQEQTTKLDCSAFKALIVDDNLLNIKVAKRLLENYKFTVESVTSGRECVDKIKEEQKYDIIFMDHMMPEMDGIETLHVLKKLDGYVLPPIIALTANAIAGMKEMYLNEGFDDYLSKPINTHELDRVINNFLKK